jgi:hypothetical protein
MGQIYLMMMVRVIEALVMVMVALTSFVIVSLHGISGLLSSIYILSIHYVLAKYHDH